MRVDHEWSSGHGGWEYWSFCRVDIDCSITQIFQVFRVQFDFLCLFLFNLSSIITAREYLLRALSNIWGDEFFFDLTLSVYRRRANTIRLWPLGNIPGNSREFPGNFPFPFPKKMANSREREWHVFYYKIFVHTPKKFPKTHFNNANLEDGKFIEHLNRKISFWV